MDHKLELVHPTGYQPGGSHGSYQGYTKCGLCLKVGLLFSTLSKLVGGGEGEHHAPRVPSPHVALTLGARCLYGLCSCVGLTAVQANQPVAPVVCVHAQVVPWEATDNGDIKSSAPCLCFRV